MANRVVVGSQWGDEGKAKVVDFLTEEADYVIRFQGGANAGHTVEVGNEKYVFHLIPSGLMHPGKVCVIGNGVVLDPAQLLKELDEVQGRGIDTSERLFIAENAQVVFPWHKLIDQLKEKAAGKDAIGTTGRGIGPCYNDKVGRNGIRVLDLMDEKTLRDRVFKQVEATNHLVSKLYANVHDGKHLDADAIFNDYRDLGRRMKPLVTDTVVLLNEALRAKQRLLFEGAQGTILDVDHGTYPFVTSSNTVAAAACTGSGVGPTAIQQVIGVVKAYTTRVGNGPFPTELEGEIGEKLREIGGEYGATTGRKRRCGWFDAVVVRRAAIVNGLTHLAITKLDVLDTFDSIDVCTGYKCEGRTVSYFPNSLADLEKCEPVFETLPGWKTNTSGVRRWEELPRNAQHYLARLSDLVGVPMGLLSLGPKRHQTIELGL
jgi:adenylosuccinate synthase